MTQTIKVCYTAKFILTLTRETVQALIKASQQHYDAHCRSYSNATGILPRWEKTFDLPYYEGDTEIGFDARWTDLDTIAKICEFNSQPELQSIKYAAMRALGTATRTIETTHGSIIPLTGEG